MTSSVAKTADVSTPLLYKKYDKFPSMMGQTVSVLGWVRKYRTAGKIVFLSIEYGESSLQMVAKKDLIPSDCTIEAYIMATGVIQALPDGKYSGLPIELVVFKQNIVTVSPCDQGYHHECPVGAGPELRLAKRHLYLRDGLFAKTTRLRAQLIQAIRLHFEQTDCLEIIPPCFTGTECEGGATLFKVPYPGKSSDKPMTAYLTQSSQFALEMAVPGVGDCYCIYPSFRAENSHTRRHLTEFLHAECEWSGVLSFQDHVDHLTKMLQGILGNFLLIAGKTLKSLDLYQRVEKLCMMAQTDQIVILEHKNAIAECTGVFSRFLRLERLSLREMIFLRLRNDNLLMLLGRLYFYASSQRSSSRFIWDWILKICHEF